MTPSIPAPPLTSVNMKRMASLFSQFASVGLSTLRAKGPSGYGDQRRSGAVAWVTDKTSEKPPQSSSTSTVQLTGSRVSGVLPATSSRLVGAPSESSTTRISSE
eukprot:scaffold40628_cov98-Phaeocystis_antarctica.AAC.3